MAVPSLPQQALTFNDVFEDEEDIDEPKEAQTIHHIRANSSIMQLKKILGKLQPDSMARVASIGLDSADTLVSFA